MTVRWTVRATEPTAVFSPQRKYKTVGSSPASATKKVQLPIWVAELFLVIEFEFVLSIFRL